MAAALGREIPLRREGRLGRAALVATPIAREPDHDPSRWDEPCLVDDTRFRARYGDLVTPLERAARQTVDDALARLFTQAPGSEAGAATG
jgi:hypothetical protein